MRFLIAAFVALLPARSFAHSGHVKQVDGHTHTLTDLVAMNAAPLALAAAVFIAVVLARRNG